MPRRSPGEEAGRRSGKGGMLRRALTQGQYQGRWYFTGKNANVMYETSIAHTLGKHVIPITQALADVPFDMQHQPVLKYLPNCEGMTALETSLAKKLEQFSVSSLNILRHPAMCGPSRRNGRSSELWFRSSMRSWKPTRRRRRSKGIRRSGFSNGCGSNMATPAVIPW
jgi:hypothetical protein